MSAEAESRWPAPAKLNLFLHVTGKRPDGYHDLQTLFQLIDLCDSIGIQVREDGRIERTAGPPGVAEDADLIVRAARALKAASGTPLGATLRVTKRIPMGGGLGGGSSGGAPTLIPQAPAPSRKFTPSSELAAKPPNSAWDSPWPM